MPCKVVSSDRFDNPDKYIALVDELNRNLKKLTREIIKLGDQRNAKILEYDRCIHHLENIVDEAEQKGIKVKIAYHGDFQR